MSTFKTLEILRINAVQEIMEITFELDMTSPSQQNNTRNRIDAIIRELVVTAAIVGLTPLKKP